VDKVYTAPLIDQMGIALGIPSRLTQEDLKHMADDKKALVDVVGLKGDGSIWIVQSLNSRRIVDSAVSRGTHGSSRLFKSRVFNDPVLNGQSLKSLILASYFMRKAFPDAQVQTLCMVQVSRFAAGMVRRLNPRRLTTPSRQRLSSAHSLPPGICP